MSVRRSAGAVFWGLVFVAVGGVLLAYNLGYPIRIWPYAAQYWPVLLIVWGLFKLIDYFRFRRSPGNRPLFSGGEIVLLILLIFAGAAMTTAANVSPEFGRIFNIGDIDLWDITGDNYAFQQHLEQDVTPGSEIEIVNLFGDVEIRSSDSDRIVLDVNKTIRASSRSEADRLEQEFTFSIEPQGLNYRIASNRDEPGFQGTPRQRFKSSLVVEVPRRSSVHLDNRNGRVTLQNLTGNQNIVNRYGGVEIRDIAGQLQLENRNGPVTVQNVSNSIVINNRYANTTVRNAGSDVQIQTRNGSVDVSGVDGNASIDNSYAPINVENVRGSLNISGRNNSVDVQHVQGDIRVDSSYQNVSIRDPRGAVTVTGRNGDLLLSFDAAPQKDVSIDTRYANVTVALPSVSAFNIDARTQYGDVYSEFEGLQVDRFNREREIRGQFGQSGPRLMITTRNGDIRLQKRG
jgi:DUF4097 and DUF4098 domain-containing protein YvlB